MPRMVHRQDDPLSFERLSPERLDYMWDRLQENLLAFDDYTNLNRNEFDLFVMGPNSYSFEIGDGVGLTTLVVQHLNAWVQMVMFDFRYRDYICRQVCDFAFQQLGMRRVTSTVTEDRDPAKKLVTGLGFEYEGKMRKAYFRTDRFYDVEIYGLLKEKHNGNSSGYSSRSDRGSGSSGIDRISGDIGKRS